MISLIFGTTAGISALIVLLFCTWRWSVDRRTLRVRWETPDGEQRLKKVLTALMKSQQWGGILEGFPRASEIKRGRDLRMANLAKYVFPSAMSRGLARADFAEANMRGARLDSINFTDADFCRADLRGAHMAGCVLVGAELGGADLRRADLTEANLERALLDHTDLRRARCDGVRLADDPDWAGAHLNFTSARFDRRTAFRRTDISRVSWAGNPLLKRHIEDQQWLDAWENGSGIPRYIWLPIRRAACVCGCSFKFWLFLSCALPLVYGYVYAQCGDHLILTGNPERTLSEGLASDDVQGFTPYYYSVVTFTTLGYGDVLPRPSIWWMQLIVITERVLGCIMLGVLVCVIATKLARRPYA